MSAGVTREPFGRTERGVDVERITLQNAGGARIVFLSYGGTIQSIVVPDRNGAMADVALGYDTLIEYEHGKSFFGAIIGRYGNRIAHGRFTLDGRTYDVGRNNGANHLHGGPEGFHAQVWTVEPFERPNERGAVLSYVSHDGEGGYPGTVSVRVTYTFTDANVLTVGYFATTDAPTPLNLTQHSYFNFAGHTHGTILDHEITIAGSRIVAVDAGLIPTGELRPVAETPFDFRAPHLIGERIGAADEQLEHAGGYDHTFALDRTAPDARTGLALAARLTDPSSGRGLDVLTTEPGMQFYSGNFLDGTVPGKGGYAYPYRGGLALETQHFPDSPNQPSFPSVILRPGEEFHSRSEYHFVVRPL